MNWAALYASGWPIIVAIGVFIAGAAAFIQNVKNVKKLKLEIEKLEREKLQTSSLIIKPTPDEVEKFGGYSRINRHLKNITALNILLISTSFVFASASAGIFVFVVGGKISDDIYMKYRLDKLRSLHFRRCSEIEHRLRYNLRNNFRDWSRFELELSEELRSICEEEEKYLKETGRETSRPN